MPKNFILQTKLALLIAIFVLAAFAHASAQQSGSQQAGKPGASSGNTGASPTSALVEPGEDYRIGPGDVIQLQVENAPEMSRSFRVTSGGTFLMPFLGRVKAQGLTPEELSQFIADRLRGEYLRHPVVTVAVSEYNSRAFFILGSVRSPGVYQIEGRPSLLKLITLAGGLTENHGSNAFIIRETKPTEMASDASSASGSQPSSAASSTRESGEEEYEVASVNINGLLRGNLDNNKFLEPRDVVHIPPADVFFVAGEVNAPGSFPLKDGTTLRQAISLAQGTTYKAATGRGIVFRDDPNGKREEILVDVGAVMSGKKPDIPIKPNDVIIVPNSQMKAVGGALLRAFGLTTVQRIPVR